MELKTNFIKQLTDTHTHTHSVSGGHSHMIQLQSSIQPTPLSQLKGHFYKNCPQQCPSETNSRCPNIRMSTPCSQQAHCASLSLTSECPHCDHWPEDKHVLRPSVLWSLIPVTMTTWRHVKMLQIWDVCVYWSWCPFRGKKKKIVHPADYFSSFKSLVLFLKMKCFFVFIFIKSLSFFPAQVELILCYFIQLFINL